MNLSVELLHHHEQHDAVSQLVTPSDEAHNGVRGQLHGFVCLACLFVVSYLAPTLRSDTLRPRQDSTFILSAEPNYYSVILTTTYYLRAPPITLS
ncbi:MAG: hypothetical protein ACE5IY_18975 [bacterium]